MHQRYKSWNEQMVVCCKNHLAEEQDNWGSRYQEKRGTETGRPWERHLQMLASTHKQRGKAALGSWFGVALGWELRAARLGLGEKHRWGSWYADTSKQENQPTAAAAAAAHS